MRISDWSSDVCSSDLFAVSCKPGHDTKRIAVYDPGRHLGIVREPKRNVLNIVPGEQPTPGSAKLLFEILACDGLPGLLDFRARGMQATPSRHVAKGIDGGRVADDDCLAYRFRLADRKSVV